MNRRKQALGLIMSIVWALIAICVFFGRVTLNRHLTAIVCMLISLYTLLFIQDNPVSYKDLDKKGGKKKDE